MLTYLLNCSSLSCTNITNQNFSCYNASVFGSLYVYNEFITSVNSCSYLLGVNNAQIINLNASTITNVANKMLV